MYITIDELTAEFYNTLPEAIRAKIPADEVDRVCKSPFHFARHHMRRSHLNTIRITHFATFYLYPNKILKLLETNDYNLKHGAITPMAHELAKEHLLKIYSDVVSVRATGLWGRGIEIVDTTEDDNTNTETQPGTTEGI